MYDVGRGLSSTRAQRILAAFLAVLCSALAAPAAAAGWDRATWGMTASEITAGYGDRALRLASPIAFGASYAEIVLRDQIFAGYPFRGYFQMGSAPHRPARVLLERRRAYATPAKFAPL